MDAEKTLLGLGRHHLDLKPFISPDSGRYALTGLRIDPGRKEAIATDGKLLILVPLAEADAESVPAISGMGQPLDQPVTLPVSAVEKAFRLVPGKAAIPALENVFLSKGEYPRVKMSATDLDTGGTIEARVVEGEYPDVSGVMKDAEKRPLKVIFDAHLLARLATFVVKHADGRLAGISFYLHPKKPNESIRFEFALKSGGMARGVLMPVRQVEEAKVPTQPPVSQPAEAQDQPIRTDQEGGRGVGVPSKPGATLQPLPAETYSHTSPTLTEPFSPMNIPPVGIAVPPAFIEPTKTPASPPEQAPKGEEAAA